MIFKSTSIDLDDSSVDIELRIEDGLPQININMNGVTVSIGTHDKFTFSDIRNLANAMKEFADYGDGKEDFGTNIIVLCSLTSQKFANKTYIKTIEPLRTCNNIHDARRFKISEIEKLKEELKNYNPKFFINIHFFARQLGQCKEYFDIVNGSIIYTTIDKNKLKELGIEERVRKAIVDRNEAQWLVSSCPIREFIEVGNET